MILKNRSYELFCKEFVILPFEPESDYVEVDEKIAQWYITAMNDQKKVLYN